MRDAMLDLKAGKTSALRTVYALTGPKIYGKLLGALHEPSKARKALLSTYLQLWHDRTSIPDNHSDYLLFIAAIAHRSAIDIRFRHPITGEGLAKFEGGKFGQAGGPSGVAVHSLDQIDQDMLTAAYLHFESVDEISQRLGLTPDRVRTRLSELSGRREVGDE